MFLDEGPTSSAFLITVLPLNGDMIPRIVETTTIYGATRPVKSRSHAIIMSPQTTFYATGVCGTMTDRSEKFSRRSGCR
jgi:hypothetical protein